MNNYYMKEHIYIVLYNAEGNVFKCNCRKFESRGILYAHILKLISLKKNIIENYERYVLKRWRRDVQRRHNKIICDAGYLHITAKYKNFKEIDKIFNEAADIAMESISRLQYMKEHLENLKFILVNQDARSKNAYNDLNVEDPCDGNEDLEIPTIFV